MGACDLTLAEWAIFAAVMLYLLTLAPIKAAGAREFDNGDPRDEAFYARPLRKRAYAAHNNGIETFPFFAAAVLLAEFRHAPQAWIDGLAAAFLVARLGYILAYVGDKPTLRSAIWALGFLINIAIFFLPVLARIGRG